MTYGYWLDRARHQLHLARQRLALDPAVHDDDIRATVAARHRVYRSVTRLVELVVDGQPARADLDYDIADLAMQAGGEPWTMLFIGLSAAAPAEHHLPFATPINAPGRYLAAAADAVGVAGDLLAGHIPPQRAPRTPEGVAIRAGVGERAALVDLATLTHDLLGVDADLPGWLATSGGAHDDSVAAIATWAARGPLAELAATLIAEGDRHPSLLRLLEPAPSARPQRPVVDGASVRAALVAARNWIYRHPDQVKVAHLAAGTRLGLVVSALAQTGPPGAVWMAWAAAAEAARRLHGSPSHGRAAGVAADLDRISRWIRPPPPHRDGREAARQRLGAIDQVEALLPSLSEVLRVAANTAARRGHFFVPDRRELQKPPGSLVWYSVTRWRLATPADEEVTHITTALSKAAAPTIAAVTAPRWKSASRLARLAFPPLTVAANPAPRATMPDPTEQGAAPRPSQRRPPR